MTKADLAALVRKKRFIRLDLGCGPSKQGEDWIGMDARKLPGVDIVYDIEDTPWPIPTNSTVSVVCSHVLEHIDPKRFLAVMDEMHRICRDGAQIFVSGPYGVGYRFQQDPTHCRPLVEATFLYFDSMHPLWEVYRPKVFHLEYFERVPVGYGTDFNAVLRCCKPGAGKQCQHRPANGAGKMEEAE